MSGVCDANYGATTYTCPDGNPKRGSSLGDTSIGFGSDGVFNLDNLTNVTSNLNLFIPSNSECPGASSTYTPIVKTIVQSITPKGGYTFSDVPSTDPYREPTGLLKSAAITGTTGLLSKLNICIDSSLPSFDTENVNGCNLKDTVFIEGVQYEYAFYYARYKYAIMQLSSAIQCSTRTTLFPSTGDRNRTRNTAVIQYTNAAIVLNMMVNDIIYIMDQIAQLRTNSDISKLTSQLNATDQGLADQATKLQRQRDLLVAGGQNEMVLLKEMEAYSRQKARYHNNMLMMYSFLNITALGLLFYVYRST